MTRPPLALYLFTLVAALIGGWMIYDGLHNRLLGDFVQMEGQLGPWTAIPRALAIDPLDLGIFFVVLGLEWIAATVGLWLRRRWGFWLGVGLSLLTLLYAFIGTVFAALALVLLLLPSTRAWLREQR